MWVLRVCVCVCVCQCARACVSVCVCSQTSSLNESQRSLLSCLVSLPRARRFPPRYAALASLCAPRPHSALPLTLASSAATPLINEYRLGFIRRRLLATFTGGFEVPSGSDTPAYVYVWQALAFVLPPAAARTSPPSCTTGNVALWTPLSSPRDRLRLAFSFSPR